MDVNTPLIFQSFDAKCKNISVNVLFGKNSLLYNVMAPGNDEQTSD